MTKKMTKKQKHELVDRAQVLLDSEGLQGMGLFDRVQVLAFALGMAEERAGCSGPSLSEDLVNGNLRAGRRAASIIYGPSLSLVVGGR
jgi:hypothetical protein